MYHFPRYKSFAHAYGTLKEFLVLRLKGCKAKERVLPAIFITIAVLAVFYITFFAAPWGTHRPIIVTIKANQTLEEVSKTLEKADVVRFGSVFQIVARAIGYNRLIQSGSYFFPEGESLLDVVSRLAHGDFGLKPVRVTFTEGDSVKDMAIQLQDKLSPFDGEEFVKLAQPFEGRLYPDTYLFYPGQDPATIVKIARDNFDSHVEKAGDAIKASGKSEDEIVTMASILVGEARTETDRKIVSGILWKRIDKGMPLQVDAPFGYILDKKLTSLERDDMKLDSPYNTYLNKGLTPTPIGNPTVGAIIAAATPTTTPYWFYLSDENGVMHYSKTYTEHKRNIEKYLK